MRNTVFFGFSEHNSHVMILTNMKAASFGLSELSGRTAQGHLLGPSGGSTAIGATLLDMVGSCGAPPDSLRIKRRKQVVFFDFFFIGWD